MRGKGGVDIVLCNNIMKVNSSARSESNANSCGNLVPCVFEAVYFIFLVSGVITYPATAGIRFRG